MIASDITFRKRYEHFHEPSSVVQSTMTAVALDVFRRYPFQYILTIRWVLHEQLLSIRHAPMWLGIGWNVVLLSTAGFGVWRLLRLRRIAHASFLLLPTVYFVAGTVMVITAHRHPRPRDDHAPLLAILAAYGVQHLLNRRRAASASPSRLADS